MQTKSILYIGLLVVLELISVSSLKYWSAGESRLFLYLGLFGYLMVGALFAYILSIHSNMTVINGLWQVLNIILVSAVGIFLYKEKLTPLQMIGVGFAILATALLAFE